jgi:glycosyltransferase involved in cell wall biosynthesis
VHVRELSRRQARNGHLVQLVYRVGGETDQSIGECRLLGDGRLWARLPHSLVSASFLVASVGTIARIRRTVEIVHLHGDYLEAVAAGCLRLLGIPALITLHGRLSPRVLRTVGFVYWLPSHIVAVSPAIASQLGEVGVPRRQITVQSSGVNREIFFPPLRRASIRPFRVVVGSALIPLKDHATLFEAVRILQRDGSDVRLHVAGTGSERDRLHQLAPPNTVFHGQLERPVLAEVMRRCNAAALTSVDAPEAGEGTPTFLMEAIACGLPFVATDTGGVPRLASASGAGLVVPQRDAAGIASAFQRIIRDKRLYGELRRAALEFGPRLDWDVVAQRLDAVMDSLIGSSGKRSGRR